MGTTAIVKSFLSSLGILQAILCQAAAVDSKDSLKLALEKAHSSVEEADMIMTFLSWLWIVNKVRHVTGVFHLAGVLDDGIIGGAGRVRVCV